VFTATALLAAGKKLLVLASLLSIICLAKLRRNYTVGEITLKASGHRPYFSGRFTAQI